MLRIRMNILLALLLAPGVWACAPRNTPAPVIMGGAATAAYPTAAGSRGSVVVQPGDTLYAISRYHHMALQTLIEANNIAPPYIIKPGQILRLPAHDIIPKPPPALRPGQPGANATVIAEKKPLADPGEVIMAAPAVRADPTADSGEDQTSGFSSEEGAVAELPPPAPARQQTPAPKPILTAAAPVPANPPGLLQQQVRFVWPAKGPILSDFGPKQNGLHNDGINIAMPPNGPVYAAGSGIVSYAGNGLRGYGNLLLIRHEGGWVTAYAHNAELLVKKGDHVTRGQQIARAGRTGGVAQDQLHFEVRKGAKAVNPKPLLVNG